jgi:curved DNA-binding protein CbpA
MKKVEEMNYYELLNIGPTANSEEIQKAYHLACHTYQTDSLALYSVISESERSQILQKIEKAYHTLMDEREREKYNHYLGVSIPRKGEERQEECGEKKEQAPSPARSNAAKGLDSGKGASAVKTEEVAKQKDLPPPDLADPQYLKKLRERKGVSLQEISEATMISVHSLTDLEKGEYARFPGRVYVVGFLRAYAEYIGIDVQQAKAHFEIIYAATTGGKPKK